ncbi:uncharacterized protein ACOB8E_019601 [Sarcophilus harrisii]
MGAAATSKLSLQFSRTPPQARPTQDAQGPQPFKNKLRTTAILSKKEAGSQGYIVPELALLQVRQPGSETLPPEATPRSHSSSCWQCLHLEPKKDWMKMLLKKPRKKAIPCLRETC